MPRAAISYGGRPPIGWPLKRTSPRVSGSSPLIRLNIVLLPAPFGPISPRISPRRSSNDRSLTATRPPNSLRAARTSSSGPVAAASARCRSGGAGAGSAGFLRGNSFCSIGVSPSGARCNSSTIRMPNTMISNCPDCPNSFGRIDCSISFNSVISVAPSTAPQTLPAPPTTAMNRYSMLAVRLNGVGLTKRCRCAYSQPDTQASSAA